MIWNPYIRNSRIVAWCLGFCLLPIFVLPIHAIDIHHMLDSELLNLHEENNRYDPEWLYEWTAHRTGVQSTAGSISSRRFYFDLDAKIGLDITRTLKFDYRYHKFESYLWDRCTHLADLRYMRNKYYAGITGMVEYQKEFNVVGAIVGFHHPDGRYIDLRCIWRGLFFNDKGPDNEEYLTDPMDIHLNTRWQFNHFRILARLIYGNEWELKDELGGEKEHKSDGAIRLEYHLGDSMIALEANGMDYSNRKIRDIDGDDRYEELDFYNIILEYRRAINQENMVIFRGGRFWADGEDDYENNPDLDEIPHFKFEREDFFGAVEWRYQLAEKHALSTGLIGGIASVDTSDRELYEQYDQRSRWKITSEYHLTFNPRSVFVFGVSYNISETRFGGGNFRVQVFI